ncbi:type III-B CRISPR module-associated protein Cmr5 [Nocardia lijiangensis]|uniref:type III-B CRISPR module-associated protein Cmr5 n=1 Tax=Nocardia lijiangensis TaxID=299618 RepID=UPI003D72AD05
MQRLDQDLAVLAARTLAGLPDDVDLTEFANRMKQIPPMVMTSGLVATGAYLLARNASTTVEDPGSYRAVVEALLGDAAGFAGIAFDSDDPNDIVDALAAATGRRYLVAENRAKLFSTWLYRLAIARAKAAASASGDGQDRP